MIFYYQSDDLEPERKHYGDAGVDLKTAIDFTLAPSEFKTIPTGVKVEIPYGYYGQLLGRSGLGSKGLGILAGVIDSTYRGEIKAVVINHGSETLSFKRGDRICQIVCVKIHFWYDTHESEPETVTSRNENGFGSTDKEVNYDTRV